jgi:hypothetical protein
MSHVDVVNRLEMNQRQQYNFDRLDAQVDTQLRKQHGECYRAPEPIDMAENRINSPTINIGVDAAKMLGSSVLPGASVGSGVASKVPGWLKTAGLLAAGAGTMFAVNQMLGDDHKRNVYDIQAVPFDPLKNPEASDESPV